MLGIFNKDAKQIEQERERARQEQLSALPAAVRQWAQELERDGRRQAQAIRKEAEQKRRPLETEAAAIQTRIDKLTGELTTAQAWLANIPEAAESGAAVERYTIAQLWPARIQEQREKLASARGRIAQLERETSAALNAVRVDTEAAILDASKRLATLRLDILG